MSRDTHFHGMIWALKHWLNFKQNLLHLYLYIFACECYYLRFFYILKYISVNSYFMATGNAKLLYNIFIHDGITCDNYFHGIVNHSKSYFYTSMYSNLRSGGINIISYKNEKQNKTKKIKHHLSQLCLIIIYYTYSELSFNPRLRNYIFVFYIISHHADLTRIQYHVRW